jgi:hypothetical protein
MANIQRLAAELADDPLGRGYSAMTDQAAADDLNTAYRQQTVVVDAAEIKRYLFTRGLWLTIKRATDDAAESARDGLSMFERFHMNDPNVAGTVEAMLDGLVSAGHITDTHKAEIQSFAVTTITRAEELNLLGASPEIGWAHVAEARS